MKIHGLQKMTLLDFPGHVACTVFLNACDFRCPFCHNYELACGTSPAVMEENELLSFLKKRKGLLDGAAFTGGEPCLHKELPGLMEKCRDLGYAIKLDTNGYHPKMLAYILEEGLADYVAMDIKNSPEKYALTAGIDHVDMALIEESIALLVNGKTEYEFRTTVVKEFHEAGDFEKMGRMIEGAKRYFLQKFTDRETVPYSNLHAPEPDEMKDFLQIASRFVTEASLRGVD